MSQPPSLTLQAIGLSNTDPYGDRRSSIGVFSRREAGQIGGQMRVNVDPSQRGPADGSRDPVVIATSGDDRFALGMAIMLHSALHSLPDGRAVDVYLLDGGITDAHKARIERVLRTERLIVSVTWLLPSTASLTGVPVNSRHTLAAYMRLLIPELLPASAHRAIYLDGDVIVERNLEDLWTMDMAGAPALGVENYSSPVAAHPGALPDTYAACGLDPSALYCNTGVLLMDLDAWRREDICGQVVAYSQRFAQYVQNADQDGINAVLGERWGELDPRWNVQILTIEKHRADEAMPATQRKQLQADILRTAFILHFAGHLKPWHYQYRRQYGHRFLHYARTSGWFDPLHGWAWSVSREISQRALYAMARSRKALMRPFA